MKLRCVGSILGALVLVICAMWATPAQADQIYFSSPVMSDYDYSYTYFDAMVDYSYSAGVLTMIIYNDTVSPFAWTLSQLHFNVSNDVTGLSILNDGPLTNTSLSTGTLGGGMGTFDYGFDLGQGNNGVLAGGNATVTFSVTGSNLDTSDFFNGLSVAPGGGNGYFRSTIHFTRGPQDDSTWVTPDEDFIIPEPATLSLLGMGLAGLVVRRLRRKAS